MNKHTNTNLPNQQRDKPTSSDIRKNRLMSGDRPTNDSYVIGVYQGTMKARLQAQDDYEVFIMSADYHAMTTHYDRTDQIRHNQISLIRTQIALGLDPEKVVFYRQSRLPQTFRLFTILGMITRMKELEKQPMLKEKLAQGHKLNFGLMGYPVLMAADILIVDSDVVPVAKDNEAHIEIAKLLAERFNKIHSGKLTEGREVLKVPEGLIGDVMIGLDGQGKSGKSTGGIFFSDSADEVRTKVMSMYTDPNRIRATDPGTVEGNPVFIYHDAFNENKAEVEDLKERYRKGTVGDVEVKEKLYQAIELFLTPVRERLGELEKLGDDCILDILRTGEVRANKVADEVIGRVIEAMGF